MLTVYGTENINAKVSDRTIYTKANSTSWVIPDRQDLIHIFFFNLESISESLIFLKEST